ncbi:hypothetical protein [Hymenobacter cavernae]|uniref:Uncharacterized protein n=1 Tax=Hymenobacter cavernae TaxID=2044852 RepID=A0ABQ1TEX3_9BACT|nr:hypothetical protein [Hymenobacter cavernae]GGE93845.1 hypothetical protein GCM10011383_00660 [Hymenobacter cavernae]
MPSSSAAQPSDFFYQKTEAELRYLVQHPDFYHPDVVAAARRELHRRGVNTPTEAAPPAPSAEPEFAELPAERRWAAPAAGLGLLLLALLGWRSYEGARPAAPKATKPLPATLQAVALRPLRSFDSLTTVQVRQQKVLLSAADRIDTTATRKYLLLARRYWTAENQAEYIYTLAAQNQTDDRFAGLLRLNAEQWHSFTGVLGYNHKLRPAMQQKLALMNRAADLRMAVINQLAFRSTQGLPLLIAPMQTSRDSAFYLRQMVLGIPANQRIVPGSVPLEQPAAEDQAAAQLVTTLPAPQAGQNPVYVLDGEVLHSNPGTGEPPTVVQQLPPESLGRIVVLKPALAVREFGPQAHDGAVVIYTKATLRSMQDEPAD